MKAFFDTNILIYANVSDPRKDRALSIIAQGGGYISVQVLNEFTNVLRRKLSKTWEEIALSLADVKDAFPVVLPITEATHSAAFSIARANEINFYDALIVASALEGGCGTLWTEDLQDGRAFGPLIARNPFAA